MEALSSTLAAAVEQAAPREALTLRLLTPSVAIRAQILDLSRRCCYGFRQL